MGRTPLKIGIALVFVVIMGATGVLADTSPGADIQQRVARMAAG